jgi:hypothetical protein
VPARRVSARVAMSKSFHEIDHLASRESFIVNTDCLIAWCNRTVVRLSFPS